MGTELIGRTGKPFRMVLEEGKVREFAAAVESRHPDNLRDHDPVAPPTYLASAVFWQSEESSALAGVERDFSRLLHGEQEFVFHGAPLKAGEVLTGQQRIADVYTKEGKRGGSMEFLVLVTEFRDEEGNLRAEATSVTLTTSAPPSQGGPAASSAG